MKSEKSNYQNLGFQCFPNCCLVCKFMHKNDGKPECNEGKDEPVLVHLDGNCPKFSRKGS